MNYWYTLQHGWVSKQLCWVKEVSQKRIYTILSPLSKTQEKCKLIYSDRRQISNCLGKDGWKGQVDRITKVHMATFGGNNRFIHLIVVMVLGVHEYTVCVCAHAHTRIRSCLTLCYLTDCSTPVGLWFDGYFSLVVRISNTIYKVTILCPGFWLFPENPIEERSGFSPQGKSLLICQVINNLNKKKLLTPLKQRNIQEAR